MSEKLKPCPCCGSDADIKDLVKNNIGHKGVIFGRIVCRNNHGFQSPEKRCYIKTVCAPLEFVIKSWNTREGE